MKIALTIAGSDSSGGAGIQADLKTFAAVGVYGCSVLTALTAQNTTGVRAVVELTPEFVVEQYRSVVDDLNVGAAKTGMLASEAIIEALVKCLRDRPVPYLVVDPVMVATSGDVLLKPSAIEALRSGILPLATVVTPNLREVEVLTGHKVDNIAQMRSAAEALVRLGARAALVKGGHLEGAEAIDIFFDGSHFHELRSRRIACGRIHGAGCTLSAAIAAYLALGHPLFEAVVNAKKFVSRAIETAEPIGHGATPLNHLIRQ